MASVDNFSGHRGVGGVDTEPVCNCLVSGPQMTGRESSGLEFKSHRKEVVGVWAPYWKCYICMCKDESFTISGNWLVLGGADSSGSAKL